jgi:hypothetical protein
MSKVTIDCFTARSLPKHARSVEYSRRETSTKDHACASNQCPYQTNRHVFVLAMTSNFRLTSLVTPCNGKQTLALPANIKNKILHEN